MKLSVLTITLIAQMIFICSGIATANTLVNGDFSDPVDLAGFTATGTDVREPTSDFAQLETDGTFMRTLEQTYTTPSVPTLLSFDFAFSTDMTIASGFFPDSFVSSELTLADGEYLDIMVADAYGVWEDPSDGIEFFTGATPIDVTYDPSVTIPGFTPLGGITFSGRISLWLPDSVLGEQATLYFDLFDELDGSKTIAAVDNISVEPFAPELWLIEYRWSTQTDPPYEMTSNPDGSTDLRAYMEVLIENTGNGDAYNVTATLESAPGYAEIVDSGVSFGDVLVQSDKWSNDDFCIRVHCEGPTDDTVWWRIEWDDVLGNHHVMQDVPMFGP